MIKLILAIVGVILLISCNSTVISELDNEIINELDNEIPRLLKDSILESLNSAESIVYGSPSFESYNILEGVIYENEILDSLTEQKSESLFIEKDDYLFIKYIYYSRGCYKYLPFIQILNNEMHIKLRKIVDVFIYKDNNTYKTNFLHTACENNMQILIAIDKLNYSKLEKVNFNDTASYLME
jgi:hypothetical protein